LGSDSVGVAANDHRARFDQSSMIH
jgi:hypothetical protein